MTLFKGAGVALVTPFREDKRVDYDTLEKLLEFQLKNETDAIIVGGTTGEPVTMTEEERLSVIEFVIKKVKEKRQSIPVIAGTGGNCTETATAFSKKAENLGPEGLLVVTPYYNKATQKGLYEHYKALAESVSLPIIMYNVPSRTGLNLLPETAVQLGKDFDNIVAIKEASGNISQVAELAQRIAAADSCLEIYSGNDDQILPIMSLGGIGVISVLSNIAPKDTHDMVVEYLEGDKEKALRLQLKYIDVIKALFSEVNPIPVKKALEYMGFGKQTLRLPLTEMDAKKAEKLYECMKMIGLNKYITL